MKEKQITGVIKYPNKPAYVEILIENTLENLQGLVRGYIETVTLGGFTVICNEEGRINRMPFNCVINDVDFYGPILIVDRAGDEFSSLTFNKARYVRDKINEVYG